LAGKRPALSALEAAQGPGSTSKTIAWAISHARKMAMTAWSRQQTCWLHHRNTIKADFLIIHFEVADGAGWTGSAQS